MGNLLPHFSEGHIRDDKIFAHALEEDENNSGDEVLLGIGADVLDIAFTRMVRMVEFLKANNEGQF